MFILDTDILSNLRKARPHPNLIHWIESVGWERLATTVMTIVEIQVGIERARRADIDVAARVEAWLAGLIEVGAPQVLPLETGAAMILGRMHETPELRNFLVHPPGASKSKTGADLAIAAIAIACDAVIATNNDRDYLAIDRHFPLPGLFNPLTETWRIERRSAERNQPD